MGEAPVVLVVFVLWMVFCVWFWGRRSQAHQRSVDDRWSELGQRTGLSYDPGSGRSLLGAWSRSKPPKLSGEYRGRPAALYLATQWIDAYDGSIPVEYTLVSVQVDNPHGYSLSVREKGLLSGIFRKSRGGDQAGMLDPRFLLDGTPGDIAENACDFIEPLLVARPTAESNRSPFFWTSASKMPSVELKDSELKWRQYDRVSDPDDLRAVLDQLCDLAEFVEKRG